MFTGIITERKKRYVTIYVEEKHWEAFEKSEELKAMKKLIAKMKGWLPEEQDKPVTLQDMTGYATWDDVYTQSQSSGKRIDRLNKLTAATLAFALMALAVALRALYLA